MSVEWRIAPAPVEYEAAVSVMEERVAAIRAGTAPELVWLLEHPPLYTAGTSARAEDLVEAIFPVHRTGRGGQFTYHGPGQRVGYVMLDLMRRGLDLKAYVRGLEAWLHRAPSRNSASKASGAPAGSASGSTRAGARARSLPSACASGIG